MTDESYSDGQKRRSLLWILNLHAGPNGASLRYLNYSKWLRRAGFSVHFAVSDSTFDPLQLNELVEGGWIDTFSRLAAWRSEGPRNGFSKLSVFPALRTHLPTQKQASIQENLLELIALHKADTCIVSDRQYLFAVPALTPTARVVIDWCDSESLYCLRGLRQSVRSGSLREVPSWLSRGLTALLEERYYPRISHANMVVSPVDSRAFHCVCPKAHDLRTVLNGVEIPTQRARKPKVSDRLVFSGRMDFQPNHQGALWFIDHVLPAVRKRRPGAHIIIAGTHPVPELRARESDFVHVTGYVPDLGNELAQAALYVAPLVSGGGFKNKIFEAIAAGTAIVGTPFAAEFLPTELRTVVRVATGAREFADAVVRCLETPALLARELTEAQEYLRLRFSWKAQTDDLLCLLEPPPPRW